MGVYSAITIDTERRQKEVAIRKVNGAGLKEIIILFARLYVWVLGISALLAFPIVYLILQQWKQMYLVIGNQRNTRLSYCLCNYPTIETDVCHILQRRHPILGWHPAGRNNHHRIDGHLPHLEDSPYQSGNHYKERITLTNKYLSL